jgi:homoserine kinase
MKLEADIRTRDELLADAAIARHQASRFREAAAIVNDDLVESALRSRARELETAVAVLEAKAAEMLLSGPGPSVRLEGTSPTS